MAYIARNVIDPVWQVAFDWVAPKDFFLSRWDNEGMPKPLRRDAVPTAATFATKRKQLPDFCLVQAWMAVSHRVYSHIAALDPGRNQFFAFDVTRKNGDPVLGPDGEPLTTPYYLVNTTNRFDAIIHELSELSEDRAESYSKYGLIFVEASYSKDSVTAVVDRAMIADHHVWEGIKHAKGRIMISDAFGEWILANKMKGVKLWKVCEADRP